MTTFAIAGLQLEGPNGDNVDSMSREIEAVVRRFPWLDMVICPELGACGTDIACAQPLPGPREAHFQALAERLGIWLLPGSFYEAAGDLVFNTTPVISPQGEVVARHRKLFPWRPYENAVAAGSQHTVFEIPDVAKFGVSICYDMWYPETIRSLAWQGAEIILHPTLTSTLDRNVELAMVRAHAAQNQCYFFDVNLAGTVGVGESIVAGPGGEVIYQAGKGREIIPLKLDLDYLRDVRQNGWQNLGQPLKSFRDSQLSYPQYERDRDSSDLDALGALRMASKGE
ncbi:MAG: carbon-nitrogen hydrolase family protein [Gammaproteobacteria bacterium]|nr:carbon-nitrogen hydrolase family protein [Gammaproteobacteria bacterium]